MRANFKNDLYYFAAHAPSSQNRHSPPPIAQPTQPKKKLKPRPIMAVDDDLTRKGPLGDQVISGSQQSGLSNEQYGSMLKSINKKGKKEGEGSANIFSKNYRPRNTLVFKKQEPSTAQKTQKEEKQELKKKNMEYKKIEQELKKAATEVDRQLAKKKKEEVEGKDPNNQEEGQGQSLEQQAKPQENKEGRQGKSKSKRIKKMKNYVSFDPKRKYRDRFVGALNSNLRYYSKNGRLKFKYRPPPSQLTFEDGQIGDTYVSSLSKALTITVNLSDSDQDSSQSQKLVIPENPQDFNKQNLTEYLQAVFGFEAFREGQFETIQHVLKGQSVVFISETASGKSLTYIMSSMLMGGLSIVVSPLVSLILDQLAHLPSTLPAACISSLITRDQRDKIIKMVKSGAVSLLFITPESLQTDFIYHLQDFPLVNFVCVDEAHSLSELSHNFRTAFLGLGQILLKHIKYRLGYPTILALTATANPETVLSIKDRLNIPNVIRSQNCMNKNLFVTISRQKGQSKYQALINYLNNPYIERCRGILVYARTRRIMFEVFNFITNSTCLNTKIYHSALTNKQKTQTLTKFRTGQIKVVVATVALGMGLDFSHLECVVHINMPKTIENYVQQIGRAGRRERRAYCHLFLDDDDYITERNYIIADQLEPKTLLALYEKLKENSRSRSIKGEAQPTKKQQADLVVRRAALMIQHIGHGEIIDQEQQEQDEEQPTITVGDCLKSKLFSIRVEKLTGATQLREEALLTLLLKIQNVTKAWDARLRVLPVSHELLKISFFKNNEEQIKNQSQFFRHLISGCKRAKGIIYINLLEKCNRFNKRPIQLLTQLYRISNTHTVKVELDSPIYVWQFEGKRRFTEDDPIEQLIRRGFDKLSSEEQIEAVLQSINRVQKTTQEKLNTFYTLARLSSNNSMNQMLNRNVILPPSKPIPKNSIVSKFDGYFRSNLKDFYNEITRNGQQIYIPTYAVAEEEKRQIYDCILMFFRNETNLDEMYSKSEEAETKRRTFLKFQDGKTITRILMGVNTGQVSWKIYGERKYWMQYKTKNYQQLLTVVRSLLQEYKRRNNIHDNPSKEPVVI